MTANQISYWNLLETQRANKAKEFENNRSNVARETENTRTNVANENIKNKSTEGQLKRWDYQNGVDVANAVTGGIGNVGKGVGSILKSFLGG